MHGGGPRFVDASLYRAVGAAGHGSYRDISSGDNIGYVCKTGVRPGFRYRLTLQRLPLVERTSITTFQFETARFQNFNMHEIVFRIAEL